MKTHTLITLLLLVILTSILTYEAYHDAGTYDEIGHITAGYTYVYLHDFRLYPDNPPLIKMLAVLPWWPIREQIKFPLAAPEYTQTDAIDWWKLGTKFLYRSGNDADKLIFLARLPIILLTLALGVMVSKFASDLYGKGAGLFAMVLYVFEPNVRAHGHLVTADLGSAFFVILSLYFLYKSLYLRHPEAREAGSRDLGRRPQTHSARFLDKLGMTPWKVYLILASTTFSLAILSKYSVLFFLPIYVLLFLFLVIKRVLTLRVSIFYLLSSIFIAYLTLWFFTVIVGYNKITFRYEDVGLNRSAREQLGDNPIWQAFHAIPLPYYYTIGLEQMYARNLRGQPSFLFGTVNPTGHWWQYFLVTYLVKTPVPLLVFLFLALINAFRITSYESRITNKNDYFSPLIRNSYFLLPFLAGFFFFTVISLTGNLSIGLRFVFPSVILFLIFASSIAASFRLTPKTLVVAVLLFLWLITTNLASLPYDISYVNELGGGTHEGYKTVSDSSYDWGQDLKRLSAWVKERNLKESITLSYLGTADPAYYGIEYKPLRFEDLGNLEGIVAISATNLILGGLYGKDASGKIIYDPSPLTVFRNKQPLARVGTTIFIYQFP